MTAAALLALTLAALAWFVRGDASAWLRVPGGTSSRRARYRWWVVKAALCFALPSFLALALLGRLGALAVMPAEFGGLRAAIGPVDLADEGSLLGVAGGAAVAGTLIGAVVTIRRRRTGRAGPMLGDVGALIPRNRGEMAHAALLSVVAGVTEEMFFRLVLPLLIVLVTGQVPAAFVAATLLFGLAHRYQGWIGVAATTAVGTLFACFYLASGSLWATMVFHALIDFNGLVLRPALTGTWRRSIRHPRQP